MQSFRLAHPKNTLPGLANVYAATVIVVPSSQEQKFALRASRRPCRTEWPQLLRMLSRNGGLRILCARVPSRAHRPVCVDLLGLQRCPALPDEACIHHWHNMTDKQR